MNILKLIEKIEGEAKLNFSFNEDKNIDFVDIEFFNTRNIEKILENKDALDALVINPRVCGICGQAHLIATVEAIEDCYDDIKITNKAKILRQLSVNFENIQNHFKWFYFTIMPLLGFKQYLLKATKPSSIMAKAISIIAGQYPHNSYAIPGGVVSEPTSLDMIKLTSYIDDTLKYFSNNICNIKDDATLNDILNSNEDLCILLNKILHNDIQYIGKSYDRFIVFGENSYCKVGKSIHTNVVSKLDISCVKEFCNKKSLAKNVKYKDSYYEVGPLSRAMVNKNKTIKLIHRKYKDSIFTRIVARVLEIKELLNDSKELIAKIDLDEKSYIQPKLDILKISGNGISSVEAARGSLIHKVNIKNGIIQKYEIITPTQWNLSNGTIDDLGISQKAMVGLKDTQLAQLVFKSFDVCSVCTTH